MKGKDSGSAEEAFKILSIVTAQFTPEIAEAFYGGACHKLCLQSVAVAQKKRSRLRTLAEELTLFIKGCENMQGRLKGCVEKLCRVRGEGKM